MIRSARVAALPSAASFCVLLLLAGCDGQGLEVVPEIDRTFGFESGADGWVGVAAVGVAGDATVEVSTEEAAAGSSSVLVALDDAAGATSGWIQREFDLAPNQAYDVELDFQLGTSDGPSATPWSVIAAATPGNPVPSSFSVVGTTETGADAFAFETGTAALIATTSAEGALVVSLGIRQDTPGTRDYFLDEVRVVLRRR